MNYEIVWTDGTRSLLKSDETIILVPNGLTKEVWNGLCEKSRSQNKTIVNLDNVRTIKCIEEECKHE